MEESRQNERRKAKREAKILRNERKLLKLQRKLHIQQQTEESIRSTRKLSASSIGLDGGVIQPGGDPLFRKHSAGLTYGGEDTDTGSAKDTQSEISLKSDLDSPGKLRSSRADGTAIRGILSRLSRPKQASHGKDMDNLPKLEAKSVTHIQHSISVPNLSSMNNLRTTYFPTEFISEGDNESNHNDEGLFV